MHFSIPYTTLFQILLQYTIVFKFSNFVFIALILTNWFNTTTPPHPLLIIFRVGKVWQFNKDWHARGLCWAPMSVLAWFLLLSALLNINLLTEYSQDKIPQLCGVFQRDDSIIEGQEQVFYSRGDIWLSLLESGTDRHGQSTFEEHVEHKRANRSWGTKRGEWFIVV